MSWIHKESAVMLAPAAVATTWLAADAEKRKRHGILVLGCVASGAMALLLAEMLVYHSLTGDLLFRFHQVHLNYELYSDYFFTASSKANGWGEGEYWTALAHRWFVDGPKNLLANKLLTLLPTFGLVAVMVCVITRYRTTCSLLLLLWLGSLMLFLNFMTVSFSAYQPLPLAPQYLAWLILPSALAVALLACRSLESRFGGAESSNRIRSWLPFGPWAAVCAIASFQDWNRIRSRDYIPIERSVAATITDSTVVVSNSNTAKHLDYYRFEALVRPSGKSLSWDSVPRQAVPSNVLVLVNHEELAYLAEVGYAPPLEWMNQEHWIAVQTFGGRASLFRLPE